MDTFECITTKLDVRKFSAEDVPVEVRSKLLEAARLSGTGLNTQHWRFILVDNKQNLKTLAEDSTSGSWVRGANWHFWSYRWRLYRTRRSLWALWPFYPLRTLPTPWIRRILGGLRLPLLRRI